MTLWVGAHEVSQHPAKFGDHRHCNRGGIIVPVCHVILQDHDTKGLSNIMGRSPSR